MNAKTPKKWQPFLALPLHVPNLNVNQPLCLLSLQPSAKHHQTASACEAAAADTRMAWQQHQVSRPLLLNVHHPPPSFCWCSFFLFAFTDLRFCWLLLFWRIFFLTFIFLSFALVDLHFFWPPLLWTFTLVDLLFSWH